MAVMKRAASSTMPAGLVGARRIVVFRGLRLGEVLCAVPAWRALRAACPGAEISWVGLPWAAELARRLPMIDHFIPFPSALGRPGDAPDPHAWPGFLATLRAQHFDWALQMHGDGLVSNPVVAQFGAAHLAGFVPRRRSRFPAAVRVPWPHRGHEIDRLLTFTDALGCPRQGRHIEFPLQEADRAALLQAWPAQAPPLAEAQLVCVHVGAPVPSRRWSLLRFAQVADRLAEQGRTVVLTAAPAATELAAAVQRAMHRPAVNLAGRTTLWTLGALIERMRLVVCGSDTGVSHIAAALHVPSVVMGGAPGPAWGALDTTLHPVLWRDLPCRRCAHAQCPLGRDCARAITADAVWREVSWKLA
jgi:ADP-heptose:LPS heptosyltransferase